MKFILYFTHTAKKVLKNLKENSGKNGKKKQYKAVIKTFKFLTQSGTRNDGKGMDSRFRGNDRSGGGNDRPLHFRNRQARRLSYRGWVIPVFLEYIFCIFSLNTNFFVSILIGQLANRQIGESTQTPVLRYGLCGFIRKSNMCCISYPKTYIN